MVLGDFRTSFWVTLDKSISIVTCRARTDSNMSSRVAIGIRTALGGAGVLATEKKSRLLKME